MSNILSMVVLRQVAHRPAVCVRAPASVCEGEKDEQRKHGKVPGSCTRGKRGEQLGKLQVPVQRPPAGSTLARQPLWFLCPTGGNSVFSPKASPTHISLQSPLLQASNSFNTVTTQGHRLLPMQLDSPLTGTLLSLTNSYAPLKAHPQRSLL